MNIASERLSLTPLKQQDMADIHRLNSHEAVAKFNTIGIPKDMDTTIEFHQPMIGNDMYKGWAIRLIEENLFIGIMGLRLAPVRFMSSEIHYSILPEYWNRGFATEALRAALHYAFTKLKLHRVEAGCAIENYGSIKVLEKAGFKKEGQKRKVLPLSSGWSDNYEYAILSEEFSS